MVVIGIVCISEDGKCGIGVEVGVFGEGLGEGGNYGVFIN